MRVRQLQHDVPELSKFGFYNKQVLVMTLNVTGDLRLLLKDKVQRTFHFFEGHIEFPLTGRPHQYTSDGRLASDRTGLAVKHCQSTRPVTNTSDARLTHRAQPSFCCPFEPIQLFGKGTSVVPSILEFSD